ncbi:putative tRNA(His) guanylyltransferase [Zostera marina]|uniref:tRNA(His) guanylyltransferase n=1 Tax=Zostera marina TaxID=29655 RepID=A0A0K9PFH4_ZOSMR|nr:putative tRNA(His) guanylyltransferase [Zostera marina]
MANSKYEYVKEFEVDDKLPLYNWIVVRIDGCHFKRFTTDHGFDKPNDECGLNLMNSCAAAMFDRFADIVIAYGFSDEYSFIWKESTEFHERRKSKILSLSVSFFTGVYIRNWEKFFPKNDLKDTPCFDARVICYPKARIIKHYLEYKQTDCHVNNQYNTCFWVLVKSGKTVGEAQKFLMGTHKKEKNDLLFIQHAINYKELPAIFRKGSFVYRKRVEETVKLDSNGRPILRSRNKVVVGHDDLNDQFWKNHSYILLKKKI